MRPFRYVHAAGRAEALHASGGALPISASATPVQYLAGGTTLIDLMRLDVLRPEALVDINGLEREHGGVQGGPDGLRLGALARMGDVAEHLAVKRDYPVIAQSLRLAASQQIRNMASLGGNVLQRTRCNYFRDTSYPCNKREPGSGCSAMEGVNRRLAVLGTSEHCIANYPGDFAVALAALDATVELDGPEGARVLRFEALHRLPGDTPHIETDMRPGELITGFHVPAGPWTRRSLYLKIRDRESYEFALASAAVALDLDGGAVREARIGLGGVPAKPWRAHKAEALLVGKPVTEETARAAAEAAFAEARPVGEAAFKIELGKRTLTRALTACAAMEV